MLLYRSISAFPFTEQSYFFLYGVGDVVATYADTFSPSRITSMCHVCSFNKKMFTAFCRYNATWLQQMCTFNGKRHYNPCLGGWYPCWGLCSWPQSSAEYPYQQNYIKKGGLWNTFAKIISRTGSITTFQKLTLVHFTWVSLPVPEVEAPGCGAWSRNLWGSPEKRCPVSMHVRKPEKRHSKKFHTNKNIYDRQNTPNLTMAQALIRLFQDIIDK